MVSCFIKSNPPLKYNSRGDLNLFSDKFSLLLILTTVQPSSSTAVIKGTFEISCTELIISTT